MNTSCAVSSPPPALPNEGPLRYLRVCELDVYVSPYNRTTNGTAAVSLTNVALNRYGAAAQCAQPGCRRLEAS
jgi:hypothetical protein